MKFWNYLKLVIQSLNINLAPALVLSAWKIWRMMKLLWTGDSMPKYQFGPEIVISAKGWNYLELVIRSLNINLAPKLVMSASKLFNKIIKLPRTGYLILKYQYGPKLLQFALKLWHKMIKLPRTGYPMPKYQFGSQISTFWIKITQ